MTKEFKALIVVTALERLEGDDYVLAKGAKSGLEFEGVDVRDLKAHVLHYYSKYRRDYYQHVLKGGMIAEKIVQTGA